METIKSIEEKAKSFKEALSRAKGFYKRFPEYKEILEKIFPELKESEDEKIWIINYLSNRILNSTIIAEKENLKKAIAWLEKQGEQKPAEWSEIDNANLEDSIYFVKEFRRSNLCDNESRLQNSRTCIEWLASLKDRVLPQPKQEWSEEDKAIIDYLLQLINNSHKEPCTKGLIAFGAEAWLKSLRPQNTWKPSEEMLEALYRVIPENVMEKSEDEILLDKLYQGLKYGRVLSEK